MTGRAVASGTEGRDPGSVALGRAVSGPASTCQACGQNSEIRQALSAFLFRLLQKVFVFQMWMSRLAISKCQARPDGRSGYAFRTARLPGAWGRLRMAMEVSPSLAWNVSFPAQSSSLEYAESTCRDSTWSVPKSRPPLVASTSMYNSALDLSEGARP